MRTSIIWFVCIMILIGIISSCKKNDTIVDNPPVEFGVRIDSLHLEKNVSRNDTMRVRLWGKIGITTCTSFSRYQEVSRDSFRTVIKVFGVNSQRTNCTPTVVELRSTIYRVFPIYAGKFTFVVQQPDGSAIQDTSIVL